MKYCTKCGKEIMDEAVICPGCGCPTAGTALQQSAVPRKAKTARLFGILSLVLLAPFGIPAIVLAVQSKKETNNQMCGPAQAGFVCGIIGLSFWAIALLWFF